MSCELRSAVSIGRAGATSTIARDGFLDDGLLDFSVGLSRFDGLAEGGCQRECQNNKTDCAFHRWVALWGCSQQKGSREKRTFRSGRFP
jgi:hypothetical protein